MNGMLTAERREIERNTRETQITPRARRSTAATCDAATGVGFFDHMLELLGRHAAIGLVVDASGDLETGAHHTVEDVGIALGLALDEALGDRAGIRRYGYAVVPMDEALGECAIDISGRPLLPLRVRPARRSRSPASTPSSPRSSSAPSPPTRG